MVRIPVAKSWRDFELFIYGKTKLIEEIVDSLNVKILYKNNGCIITDPNSDPCIVKPSSHIHVTRISTESERLAEEIIYEVRDPKLEDLFNGERLGEYVNFRLLRHSRNNEYEVEDGQFIPTESYVQRVIGKNVTKTEYFSDIHWTEERLNLSRNSAPIPYMFMRKELRTKDVRSGKYRYKGYSIFEGNIGELVYRTKHNYELRVIGKIKSHGKVFFLSLDEAQQVEDVFGGNAILNKDWYVQGITYSRAKRLKKPVFQVLVSHETAMQITNLFNINPISDFLYLRDALVMALFHEKPIFKVDGVPLEVHSHRVYESTISLPKPIAQT